MLLGLELRGRPKTGEVAKSAKSPNEKRAKSPNEQVDRQTIKVATRAKSPIGEIVALGWRRLEELQTLSNMPVHVLGKELRTQSNQHSRGLVERLEELRTLSNMPDRLAARSVGRNAN